MSDIKVTHVVLEELSRHNERKFNNGPAYITETSLYAGKWVEVPENEIRVQLAKSVGSTVDEINKGTHTEQDGVTVFTPPDKDSMSDSFAVYREGDYYLIGRYFDYNRKDQETVEIEYDMVMAVRADIFSQMIDYQPE